MEYEKNVCPVLNVDGILAAGKQFDLEITLPEDNRNVIYGVVKDCCHEPVCDAVVKLVEVVCECGKEERRPVSHTFTDEDGEFVFGPLCANRFYEIEIWVDKVKHLSLNFRRASLASSYFFLQSYKILVRDINYTPSR